MPFQPAVDQEITIDGTHYRVAAHPAAPDLPYGQEGRQATVYQLATVAEGDPEAGEPDFRALKVFKSRYRVPALVALADRLATHAMVPGLTVCRRTVLRTRHHNDLLRAYPELTYSVLMPWIDGPTWLEVLLARQRLTPAQSLGLARALADLLATMEERGLAHCDLSSANLLLPVLAPRPLPTLGTVELVDVEQIYGPGLDRPAVVPAGSAGYAHRSVVVGVWQPEADRFAGAVLLAEMLAWCDPRARSAAWGESVFEAAELQQQSERYQLVLMVLRERWGNNVASLLAQAWQSETLYDCATFGEWLMTLPEQAPADAPEEAGDPVAESAGPMPDAIQVVLGLAGQLERQGNADGALAAYRQALALAPPGSELAHELARRLSQSRLRLMTPELTVAGQPEAIGPPAPAGEPLPDLFDAAVVAYQRGDISSARELLTEVTRRQPEFWRGGRSARALLAEINQEASHESGRWWRADRRWVWGAVAVLLLGLLFAVSPLLQLGGPSPLSAGTVQPLLTPTETSKAAPVTPTPKPAQPTPFLPPTTTPPPSPTSQVAAAVTPLASPGVTAILAPPTPVPSPIVVPSALPTPETTPTPVSPSPVPLSTPTPARPTPTLTPVPPIPTQPVPTPVPTVALTSTPEPPPLNPTPPPDPPTATPGPVTVADKQFIVESTRPFQDTGILVQSGMRVKITYVQGLWNHAHGRCKPYDASGPATDAQPSPLCYYICDENTREARCDRYPAPHRVTGLLIGTLGNQLLEVGRGMEFTATRGGPILLGMNDDNKYLDDNGGSVQVRIVVIK